MGSILLLVFKKSNLSAEVFMNKLREFRKSKILTLEYLAALCGRSPSHISRILRGERVPSAELYKKLSEILESRDVNEGK